MLVLVIVLAGTFVSIITYYNWKIITGIRADDYGRVVARAALQISTVLFVSIVWFRPLEAILYGLFPPLALIRIGFIQRYWDFLWPILLCALVVAAVVSVIASRIMRNIAVGAALAAFFAVFFVGSEVRSRIEMCATAAELGVHQIKRNSFFWTLRNAPREFQFGLHGFVEIASKRYAWSYREIGWYELPERARNSSVLEEPISCG